MEPKVFLNQPISSFIGVKEVKGEKFGIELELEGRNVALQDVATKGWNRHHEPSLRGESIEYTTAGAKSFEETVKLVDDLFKKLKENGVALNDSVRAGTHVHLNFSDQPVKNVINFFALFTLLEEILQYYSGEDRKGNLHCVSTREAEGVVGIVADAIAKGSLDRFSGDRYKYAACNLSSLYKFGTVEIRTMRAAQSAGQINTWVDILNDMYVYSLAMISPAELIKDLSHLGAEALMKKIFKLANYNELMKFFPAPQNLHYSLMEGARIIQVFAYGFEEDFTAKVEIKKKEKGGARLPDRMAPGMAGLYQIYLPDGRRWFVNRHRPGFFVDGERLHDEPACYWDEGRQRFVVEYADGTFVACNWRKHHLIPDEGPPEVHLMPAGPFARRHEEDNEIEEEWDEPDEERDEGDDF
jgi:hypothetical protein